ncbi:uncharacterized mitochondrial protein AtMg00860-like [Nicotiana tomentosiformis]|uniref:uncharacterized mitochondrial protein AtMg00860-like n=1 Tax=Nicotiana tomentosiformis TaxID=4098 RepID=UPI00388CD624
MARDSLVTLVHVSMSVGDSIIVDYVYWSGMVTIGGLEMRLDLLLLIMGDFDIILGMYWLSLYHDVLDYHAKTVTKEEHARHLRIVLQTLREKKIYAKFSKCESWLDSLVFLGHVVSSESINVYPKKIEVVQSLPRPSLATEIQSFLGLARYFRRFVEGFPSIAAPLTRLAQKGALFKWSDEC